MICQHNLHWHNQWLKVLPVTNTGKPVNFKLFIFIFLSFLIVLIIVCNRLVTYQSYHSSREFEQSSRNNYSLSGSSWRSDINSKDLVWNLRLVFKSSAILMMIMQMQDLTSIWQWWSPITFGLRCCDHFQLKNQKRIRID